MKRQLVLKIESKEGDIEEYVISDAGLACLDLLLKNTKPVSDYYICRGRQCSMLERTQDIKLVVHILNRTDVDLSEKELDDLLKRFSNDTNIERAVLNYCWNNKKELYRKFDPKCTTWLAMQFKEYIRLKDSTTKNDT